MPTMHSELSQDELAALKATRSGREWDAVCDRIKDARGGHYPRDWFDRVVLFGLARKVAVGWDVPGDGEIKVVALP